MKYSTLFKFLEDNGLKSISTRDNAIYFEMPEGIEFDRRDLDFLEKRGISYVPLNGWMMYV